MHISILERAELVDVIGGDDPLLRHAIDEAYERARRQIIDLTDLRNGVDPDAISLRRSWHEMGFDSYPARVILAD